MEFVLVGTLLTALTLAVLQLAFAIYVRNVLHDAAVEGAYYAALADTTTQEGEERAREVIRRALGRSHEGDRRWFAVCSVERASVTVRAGDRHAVDEAEHLTERARPMNGEDA
ncbi:pilus assembly protein [Microbacterium sp. BLY]|nr:pilus assembly protein [Microbacterium sp. BLY]